MNTDLLPTVESLTRQYDLFMSGSEEARAEYRKKRLELLTTNFPLVGNWEELTTSGTRGAVKKYWWGPNFNEVYRFILGLIFKGARNTKRAVLVLTRVTFEGDPTDVNRIDEKGPSPLADVWLQIAVGSTRLDKKYKELLRGHDIIVSPSHFELLDRHLGISAYLDDGALITFTGDPLSPVVKADLNARGFEVRDWMRSWDGGATFFTCQYGNRHWLHFFADIRFDGDLLYATDYYNLVMPFVDYHNGDVVSSTSAGSCQCGHESVNLKFIDRAAHISFGTPSLRFCNYRGLRNMLVTACDRVGIQPDNITTACFGRHLKSADVLKVSYLLPGATDQQLHDLESAYTSILKHAFRFKDVVFERAVESTRKVKLMYYME